MPAPHYPTCKCCDKEFMTYAPSWLHHELCASCDGKYTKGSPCHGKGHSKKGT